MTAWRNVNSEGTYSRTVKRGPRKRWRWRNTPVVARSMYLRERLIIRNPRTSETALDSRQAHRLALSADGTLSLTLSLSLVSLSPLTPVLQQCSLRLSLINHYATTIMTALVCLDRANQPAQEHESTTVSASEPRPPLSRKPSWHSLRYVSRLLRVAASRYIDSPILPQSHRRVGCFLPLCSLCSYYESYLPIPTIAAAAAAARIASPVQSHRSSVCLPGLPAYLGSILQP